MRTDVHTAMMNTVDFIAVCAKVPKDAVQKQGHVSWKCHLAALIVKISIIIKALRYPC